MGKRKAEVLPDDRPAKKTTEEVKGEKKPKKEKIEGPSCPKGKDEDAILQDVRK